MPDKSRVPPTLNAFDVYINTTDNYLQAIDPLTSQPNWQRLELKSAEAAWWHGERVLWRDTLNPKRADKTKKTVVLTSEITNFRANFKKMSARILDKIAAADAAGSVEEGTFNLILKKNRKKPGYHQMPIADPVGVSLKHMGGGRLHISCRAGHHLKRAALAAISNSVQLAFSFDAPGDPDHNAQQLIFTRASFSHDFGGANVGRYVYIYARWYHTKHPQLAGPWSNWIRTMIA